MGAIVNVILGSVRRSFEFVEKRKEDPESVAMVKAYRNLVNQEMAAALRALAEKKKEQNVAINGNQLKPGDLVYAARYNEYSGQDGQWNINYLSNDLEEAMRLWRHTYKPWLEKKAGRVAELVQVEVTVLQRGSNDN